MSTIVYFDISADDPVRAKRFYETLFGWMIDLLPGSMNYYLIETKDWYGNKAVGGGIGKRENPQQSGIMNFIEVLSVDEMVKRAFGLFQEDKEAR